MYSLAAGFFALVGAMVSPAHAGDTPANDDCSDALTINLGRRSFSNVGATTSTTPGACFSIGRDVWFRYRNSFDGTLRIRTCGLVDFDSVIIVYRGCTCSNLTRIACSDDTSGCNAGSSFTLEVDAGTCYMIRVGGFNGDSGNGVLELAAADSGNAATANRIKTGTDDGENFGFDVDGDGRFNVDSFEDVVVGSHRNDLGGNDAGRAVAYRGAALPLLYEITGGNAGDLFGFSVATDCDCNDDGRDDIIVGAPANDANGTNSGHVYVFSGFNGDLLWDRAGVAALDRFGHSVDCAGDVDNDGYDDVIVGAPYNDAAGANAGRAYLLDGQNGNVLRVYSGQSAGGLFGWSVAGIGDLNDDGKDDVVVGAPRHDRSGAADAGRISVFNGATGTVLRRLDGDSTGDQFGYSVAGSTFQTDVAEYTFVAVGAPFSNAGGVDSGRVKVFFRNHTNPGELGCNSALCLRYTINGGNPGDRFGSSVDLDDLLGNSVDDFIVGAPRVDLNGTSSGAVYVFNGSTTALGYRFFGETAGDQFGYSVSQAGDVNIDGDGDLIVGAPYNDAGGTSGGRAYVFFLDDSPNDAASSSGGEDVPHTPLNFHSGDINTDGRINVQDLSDLMRAWGPCGDLCPADLSGDGKVDEADLQLLLERWQL